MSFSGAVLAGGRSSRFGSNKAEFIWCGKTLLEWALLSFDGLEDVMIVGGANHPLARDSLMPVTRDSLMPVARIIMDTQPFAGALYGLATALKEAKYPRVAIMACDMPNLVSAYWQLLFSQTADVVIAQNSSGQLEPLAAVYSKTCLTHIENALNRDDLKLTSWWQQTNLTVQVIAWAELEPLFSMQLFLNANYKEDLL